jgi:hypothetical protein
MFNQYNEPTNYMTYDSRSLSQNSYKHFDDIFPVYQQYQDLYYLIYFTIQINQNVSPQSRDPSNSPCDLRPTLYDGLDGFYGENLLNDITQFQTRKIIRTTGAIISRLNMVREKITHSTQNNRNYIHHR